MFRVPNGKAFANGRWETDRDGIEVPAAGGFLETRDEIARSHARAGRKLPFLFRRHQKFHVRAADIDDQDALLHGRWRLQLFASAERVREPLKNPFALRLWRSRGRPALDDLQRDAT